MASENIDPSKYVTLPIEHEDLWNLYQKTLDTFWTSQDINLANDVKQFILMSKTEREFILNVTTVLFLIHKSVLNKEFFIKIMNDTEIKEASYFFGSQADTKKTHTQVYAMILGELCPDEKFERIQLMVTKHRKLLKWSMESLNASKKYTERLLSFAVLQAIILGAPIAAFESISKRDISGTIPGLLGSNRLIARDLKLHVDFLSVLFNYIQDKPGEDMIRSCVVDAVNIVKEFIIDTESVKNIGLTNENFKTYIEHVADNLLVALGTAKLYRSENPYEFMNPYINPKSQEVQYQNTISTVIFDETKFTIEEDF